MWGWMWGLFSDLFVMNNTPQHSARDGRLCESNKLMRLMLYIITHSKYVQHQIKFGEICEIYESNNTICMRVSIGSAQALMR